MTSTGPINNGDGSQYTLDGDGPQNNNSGSGFQINTNVFGLDIFRNWKTGKIETPEEQKQACLGSLFFRNMDAREQDISLAHPMTCSWFFEVTQFQQWRDRIDPSNHHGVLWIKGNPGTGKSTLMKHVLRHCQQAFAKHTILGHFFNARGDSFEKTSLGMLRSLLYQLLEKEPSVYDSFKLIFQRKREKHKLLEWEWRETELKDFFLSQIPHLQSRPLIFLIDALDECSEAHVRSVVEFLEDLSTKAIDVDKTLNICLSSRHYPHISMKKHLDLVVDERKEHNDDIAIYVRDKLTKRDNEIENEVLDKASGVFMWVVLVVAMLNKAYDEGRVDAMKKTLQELPNDLEEVFQTLLSKEAQDRHETVFVMLCVLLTRRLLSPEELYFAMVAGTNPTNLREWDPSKTTPEDIRRRITYSSRGLIEVRQGEIQTVQFIHETVKDFLLRNKRLQSLDRTLESNLIGIGHDRLRSCCMSYLMTDVLPAPKDRTEVRALLSAYPFLEYASTHVLAHAEEAHANDVGQAGFLQQLVDERETLDRVQLFHNSFEEKPNFGCMRGVDLLYMLATHGHNCLVKVLLNKGASINALGGLNGTALHAAVANGEKKTAEILLNMGAKVNAKGGGSFSALMVATVHRHNEIMKMLMEKGADAKTLGGFYGTVLPTAIDEGLDEDVIAMLLEKGADINAVGGIYGTALQAAVAKGDESIIRILLEKGADINAVGGIYGTALQASVAEADESIIEILLEKGADINAVGGIYGTALQAAAENDNASIIRMLLEKGADINAVGGVYGTALQASVAGGNESIIRILLEKGADINAIGGIYGIALQAAAIDGKGWIIEILLDNGAAINVATPEALYPTAIQAAIASEKWESVAILIANGAELEGFNSVALHAAIFGGNDDVEAMLLDKAININAHAPGGVLGTALKLAIFMRKSDIAKMLIKKGADIHDSGGIFGTALHMAILVDDTEVLQMLLSKGADPNIAVHHIGTALELAIQRQRQRILGVLLENRACAHVQDGRFETSTGPWHSLREINLFLWSSKALLGTFLMAISGLLVRFLF